MVIYSVNQFVEYCVVAGMFTIGVIGRILTMTTNPESKPVIIPEPFSIGEL